MKSDMSHMTHDKLDLTFFDPNLFSISFFIDSIIHTRSLRESVFPVCEIFCPFLD